MFGVADLEGWRERVDGATIRRPGDIANGIDLDSDNAWHRLAAGTEEVLPQVLRSCRVSLGPIAGEGAEGFDGDGAPRTGDNNACDRDAVRDALGLTRCVGKRRGMRIESHWLGTGSPGGIRQDLGGGNFAFFSPGWPRC